MPLTSYIQAVRAIAVLGAVLFAYLAVIPAALVGATVDPGCESSCGYSAGVSVYLIIAFSLCAVVLICCAVVLVAFAARPSRRTRGLVGRWLRVSAAAIGALLFSEFALIHPVASVVIAVGSLGVAWLITRGRPPGGGPRRAVGSGSHPR
jgi:hypothetical protein